MAEEEKDTIRLAVNIPISLRQKLQDISVITRLTERELVVQGLEGFLNAVVSKKGEKMKKALEILAAAREEDL